jgi:hypothetical protein
LVPRSAREYATASFFPRRFPIGSGAPPSSKGLGDLYSIAAVSENGSPLSAFHFIVLL